MTVEFKQMKKTLLRDGDAYIIIDKINGTLFRAELNILWDEEKEERVFEFINEWGTQFTGEDNPMICQEKAFFI